MNGIRPIRREQLFFEDVDVGAEIPSLAKAQYTPDRLAMFSALCGDFCAGHFDYKTAKSRFEMDRPFAYGVQVSNAYPSQMLTDWIGPDGVLKKFKSRMETPVFDGDSIVVKGKVTKKYSEDAENYVECEFWVEKQDGNVAARGVAVVILPNRSS